MSVILIKANLIVLRLLQFGFAILAAAFLLACNPQTPAVQPTIYLPDTPTPAQAGTPTGVPPTANPDPSVLPSKGNADVEFVRAVQSTDGSWTFYVTVRHPDQGWEDYADGWDIVLPDGTVLKPDPEAKFSRTLLHPHIEEQPFTRSVSDVMIPAGTHEVLVRAHDLVDGFGGEVVIVDFQARSGTNYLVESGQ